MITETGQQTQDDDDQEHESDDDSRIRDELSNTRLEVIHSQKLIKKRTEHFEDQLSTEEAPVCLRRHRRSVMKCKTCWLGHDKKE